MTDFLRVTQASQEEQGSFCDRESQMHYQNTDFKEAENQAEQAMYQGADVDCDALEEGSTDDRYNVSASDYDRVGHPHSAKYSPGR